jgi:hypothetical protein
METTEVIAITGVLTAIAGVAIAFFAAKIQERQFSHQKREEEEREDRLVKRLGIFHLCLTKGQKEEQIFEEYKKSYPSSNKTELQTLIYEMLVEKTLVFNADWELYEATSHKLRLPPPHDPKEMERQQQQQQQQ